MSGTEEPDDDRDLLAAEYVLGTLDPIERAYVERQATGDAALSVMIEDWQGRLAPLYLLAPEIPPPADLWRRIEDAIEPEQAPRRERQPVAARPLWRRVGLWQGATVGGFAMAAALALFLVLHPAVSTVSVAALAPVGGGAPVFVAAAESDGTLRLQPVASVTVPTSRDLELWALAEGATRPVSLGVLPAAGRRGTVRSLPAPHTQLLVSLEPQGGSPTGQPTGPVLYGGTLTQVD